MALPTFWDKFLASPVSKNIWSPPPAFSDIPEVRMSEKNNQTKTHDIEGTVQGDLFS